MESVLTIITITALLGPMKQIEDYRVSDTVVTVLEDSDTCYQAAEAANAMSSTPKGRGIAVHVIASCATPD